MVMNTRQDAMQSSQVVLAFKNIVARIQAAGHQRFVKTSLFDASDRSYRTCSSVETASAAP
jgi:hypothetical protein